MVVVVSNIIIIIFIIFNNKTSYEMLRRSFSHLPSGSSSCFSNSPWITAPLYLVLLCPWTQKLVKVLSTLLKMDGNHFQQKLYSSLLYTSNIFPYFTTFYILLPIYFSGFHVQSFRRNLIPILLPSSCVTHLGQVLRTSLGLSFLSCKTKQGIHHLQGLS